MRSILLLPLVDTCLKTTDVCIWRMFVFMSVVGSVGMFVVLRPLSKTVGFLSLGVLKCVCVVDLMDALFSVCNVRSGAVGARAWEV